MSEFNHNQTASSASWAIAHNLAADTIALDVFIDIAGNLEKILPSNIVHTNNNTVTVTFSSAQTGKARVIGVEA